MPIAKTPQILYLEEHMPTAQLVQARLQQLGYEVELADSSAAGLKLLARTQYQLILLNPTLDRKSVV